ncbi:MAG: anthrax toxin-like adenylyl cyclase domain-containing protein, partial [Saprospiraceae bacterium]|nr:anthrax toxin-like adenylyl cyclase domain-containing protein [Saprospiraceae bacterium]
AVTQVDVVGHSLGGVLPRVYASGQYNPDYVRSENFFEGDINRLVTVGATHFGSHLGELQVFLEDASIFDIGPLEWIVAQGQAFITSWFTGTPASPAVRDQLPPPSNEALAKLGRTEIPAHAITLSVDRGQLKSATYDPHEEYFDLYWYISLLLYHNDDLRDLYLDYKLTLAEMGYKASTTLDGGDPQELFPGYNDIMLFKQMIEDGLRYAGQLMSILDGTFELPSDIEILHWVMSETGMGDIADPLLQIYQLGSDPAGVVTKYFRDALMPNATDARESYLSVYDENMEALRALIFNNDKNDGVVRVESQSGELEDECPTCVSHYENVLHGFAPRYPEVQQGLTALLKGGMEQFHADGFPPVDDGQLLYYPEHVSELFKVPVTGPAAVCRSGMVPAHAKAFARVADEQNAIIIARPVNPDGLPLIQRGAATKVMDVKPKSSNWGPQRGYLPARQRYSKLWKVFEGSKRDEMISKYDDKVTENLTDGITVERHLTVNVCNGTYEVFIDENKNTGMTDMSAEDEVVLVPMQDNNMVCYWQTDATGKPQEFSYDMTITNCVERTSDHFLTEFKVMATPDVMEEDGVTPRFLTADYDLLMVGFYEGPGQGAPAPPEVDFLPGVGQITPAQQDLVARLNQEVARTGYDGGNVTHHGPENQFSGSPYVDYPLTVFAPDDIPNGFFSGSQGGKILSIDMGPP